MGPEKHDAHAPYKLNFTTSEGGPAKMILLPVLIFIVISLCKIFLEHTPLIRKLHPQESKIMLAFNTLWSQVREKSLCQKACCI